jgi:hypothetical protein
VRSRTKPQTRNCHGTTERGRSVKVEPDAWSCVAREREREGIRTSLVYSSINQMSQAYLWFAP